MRQRQLILFWERLQQLTLRETRRRYKDTVLGWLWIVFTPVIQALIISYVFVRIVGIKSADGSAHTYIFIVLTGLTIWNFISHTVSQSMTAFSGSTEMVNYQPVPLILLPAANVSVKTLDLLIEIAVLIFLWVFTGGHLGHVFWVGILPFLAAIILFASACALIASLVGILVRDFGHLISFILSIWFWLTPIYYPATLVSSHLKVMNLNPLLHFLAAFRDLVMNNTLDVEKIAKLFVTSFIMFVISLVIFQRQHSKIYDHP